MGDLAHAFSHMQHKPGIMFAHNEIYYTYSNLEAVLNAVHKQDAPIELYHHYCLGGFQLLQPEDVDKVLRDVWATSTCLHDPFLSWLIVSSHLANAVSTPSSCVFAWLNCILGRWLLLACMHHGQMFV